MKRDSSPLQNLRRSKRRVRTSSRLEDDIFDTSGTIYKKRAVSESSIDPIPAPATASSHKEKCFTNLISNQSDIMSKSLYLIQKWVGAGGYQALNFPNLRIPPNNDMMTPISQITDLENNIKAFHPQNSIEAITGIQYLESMFLRLYFLWILHQGMRIASGFEMQNVPTKFAPIMVTVKLLGLFHRTQGAFANFTLQGYPCNTNSLFAARNLKLSQKPEFITPELVELFCHFLKENDCLHSVHSQPSSEYQNVIEKDLFSSEQCSPALDVTSEKFLNFKGLNHTEELNKVEANTLNESISTSAFTSFLAMPSSHSASSNVHLREQSGVMCSNVENTTSSSTANRQLNISRSIGGLGDSETFFQNFSDYKRSDSSENAELKEETDEKSAMFAPPLQDNSTKLEKFSHNISLQCYPNVEFTKSKIAPNTGYKNYKQLLSRSKKSISKSIQQSSLSDNTNLSYVDCNDLNLRSEGSTNHMDTITNSYDTIQKGNYNNAGAEKCTAQKANSSGNNNSFIKPIDFMLIPKRQNRKIPISEQADKIQSLLEQQEPCSKDSSEILSKRQDLLGAKNVKNLQSDSNNKKNLKIYEEEQEDPRFQKWNPWTSSSQADTPAPRIIQLKTAKSVQRPHYKNISRNLHSTMSAEDVYTHHQPPIPATHLNLISENASCPPKQPQQRIASPLSMASPISDKNSTSDAEISSSEEETTHIGYSNARALQNKHEAEKNDLHTHDMKYKTELIGYAGARQKIGGSCEAKKSEKVGNFIEHETHNWAHTTSPISNSDDESLSIHSRHESRMTNGQFFKSYNLSNSITRKPADNWRNNRNPELAFPSQSTYHTQSHILCTPNKEYRRSFIHPPFSPSIYKVPRPCNNYPLPYGQNHVYSNLRPQWNYQFPNPTVNYFGNIQH